MSVTHKKRGKKVASADAAEYRRKVCSGMTPSSMLSTIKDAKAVVDAMEAEAPLPKRAKAKHKSPEPPPDVKVFALREDAKPGTLVSIDGHQYDFEPTVDGRLRVRCTMGKHATAYYLPPAEARMLWKRLVGKGATKW